MKLLTKLLSLFFIPALCFGQMSMSDEVEKVTDNIRKRFPDEVSLCLSYEMRGDTVHINDYRIPFTIRSGRTSVMSTLCGDSYGISWHTHPGMLVINKNTQEYYLRQTGTPLTQSKQLLYLTTADAARTLKFKKDYAIVATSSGWAYWSYDQILSRFTQSLIRNIQSQTIID